MAQISILGGGAFGTAVATLLARNGHEVLLWCYEQTVVDAINTEHENSTYLAGITLSNLIKATISLEQALDFSPFIFQAIPVAFLRKVLESTSAFKGEEKTWVTLSKGIEQDTFCFPSQIIQSTFGVHLEPVVVSGPNFAKDLATGVISAATVASNDFQAAQKVAELLNGRDFKSYMSADPIGTQVGGALKNVITLAIGMVNGAGYGENTKAFIFTAGLNELGLLARTCGGRSESIIELCGVGDLVLTSMGSQSRNLKCGALIGSGVSLSKIKEHLPVLPEGVNTVQSVHQLIEKHNLNLPICKGVYNVMFDSMSIDDLMTSLLRWEGEWCYSY